MSTIIITYPSAGHFWLHANIDIIFGDTQKIKNRSSDIPIPLYFEPDPVGISALADELMLPLPVTLLCNSEEQESEGDTVIFKKREAAYPPESFVHFKEGEYDIYAASPELCFLLAAQEMDLAGLALFGTELCGLYFTDPKERFGQFDRTPIASAQSIAGFLKSAEKDKYSEKAKLAVKYVNDNSNSPMESRLSVICSLPVKWGGYGMKGLRMNEKIILSEEGKQLYRRGALRGDMVWPGKKVEAEYNSTAWHWKERKQASDSNRQNALLRSGWKVINLTYSNVKTFMAMDTFMKMLSHELKMLTGHALLKNENIRKDVYMQLFGKS